MNTLSHAPAPRFLPKKRERRGMFNINIPPSLWERLTQAAEDHAMTRNEFVEDALKFALDHLPEHQ